jgi:2-desacetyl-2-hydroxyethyl bacteriochlorophyllide A dehydrogenase
MEALVYHGAGDLRVEQRPTPIPGPGEVVVRVEACGICGTDLRIVSGSHRAYPDGTVRVPGHEIAGTVAAAGAGVDIPEGAPVFVAPNVGCGTCRQCRRGRVNLCRTPNALGITLDGGFSTHVLVPAAAVEQGNVMVLDRPLDAAVVSVVEPLACVLRGQAQCDIRAGDVVLIVGAGPIGLLHLLAARVRGPSAIVVSEPSAGRRRRAADWGADQAVDPEAEDLATVLGEAGADVIVVATPVAAAQAEALRLAATGARINYFGGLPKGRSEVALDTNLIHYKELVVTGTTANTNDDCRAALELVAGGAVDAGRLVTGRRPLAEARDAFDAARSGAALKVVIEP